MNSVELLQQWEKIVASLSDHDKLWIVSYDKHKNEIARQLLDLDDYVSNKLAGEPDHWSVSRFGRLVNLAKEIVENEKH